MLLLGLNLGHDPSAALLDGRGRVLAAAHEARFTRVKKERRFPHLAVASVLRAAGRAGAEVEVVAYSCYDRDSHRLVRDKFLCGVGDLQRSVRGLILDRLASLGVRPAELAREDHHFAHACAAQMSCTAPDPLILTGDGFGDGLSFTARRARGGRVPADATFSAPVNASLGLVYQYVTGGLGYSMLSEEWKVLGLEPRGEPERAAELFEDLFGGEAGIGAWNGEKLAPWSLADGVWETVPPAERRDALRRYMELKVPRFERRDVASGVQELVERRLLSELERLRSGSRVSLALAGGNFLNVKLNRFLGELDWVANVSVFPAAGDGGNAVGAPLAYLQRTAPEPPVRGVTDVYWGEDRDAEVAGACAAAGLDSRPLPEQAAIERIADAVASGEIVAIVRGRSEFGPRALLNRSIVCRADRPELAALLTRGLRRDPVMPFGCSMLASEANTALLDRAPLEQCLRFMVGAPFVGAEFGRRYGAVCHPVPGGGLSTRPHLVADDGSWQARFLRAVGERIGAAVVLNTSFNLHGEPIVETPADALSTFRQAAFPRSVLLLGDRAIPVEALGRGGHRSIPPPPTQPEPPRRRREACVCLVFGETAQAELRDELGRLGLEVIAERAVPGTEHWEGRALLVAGTESAAMVGRCAARVRSTGLPVLAPASNAESGEWLTRFFPREHAVGAFADLLIWPGATPVATALEALVRSSPLALAGLLYLPRQLLEDREERVAGGGIAAVFGTCVGVPGDPDSRIYLYAPEGKAALVRLVRRLAPQLRDGDFLACRQAGLTLAYAPAIEPDRPLEETARLCRAWQVDSLVAARPGLDRETARRLERLARDLDLSVVGGSDCAPGKRKLRPRGVGATGLGRFLNRFPGLEL